MESLRCPVCHTALKKDNRTYYCVNKHAFDCAKSNYVNLLHSQQSKTKQHGDEKVMVVSRRRFLEQNYYLPLVNVINDFIESTDMNNMIVDMGCGEGYYTEKFRKNHQIIGVDISKDAIDLAARKYKERTFVVASTYDLPIMDESMDIAISVFAPYSLEDTTRVLKKGGSFILVYPLEHHLFELKQVAYSEPYLNDNKALPMEGFELVETRFVHEQITLQNQQEIQDLFSMTPYFHRTPKSGLDAIGKLDTLSTRIEFGVSLYKKR